jgi:Xaa-Pro dipeptidase
MRLPVSFHQRKVSQIQEQLANQKLDALLILNPSNIYYTSGFFHVPTERPIGVFVPQSGSPIIFIPKLEEDAVQKCWIKDVRVYFEYPGKTHPVVWMCQQLGVERLGIDNVSHNTFLIAQQEVKEIIPSNIVGEMRLTKDPEEIELLEAAGKFADYAVETARAAAKPGVSEIDILKASQEAVLARMEKELDEIIYTWGGVTGGLIYSGPRSAFPHGMPSINKVQAGDVLILSMGSGVGGYRCESERTFIVGKPTARQRELFEVMAEAQRVGNEALHPGVRCCDVNEKCLNVIRQAGLEEYIKHRMGHGKGLEGHEPPWIEEGDETVLREGMVVSSEPGIYVPGFGGFRHSDTLIVTAEGARSFTHYALKLEELIIPV